MANKRFYQFLYSKHPMLTMINGIVGFGSSGAVTAVSGNGVYGVTKLTTGIYEIKLVDNFPGYIDSQFNMQGGVTGASVTAGSFVTGTLYQITSVGTTTWSSAGFDSDFTAAVGATFVATGAGSGTGTAKAIGSSGVAAVEIAQNPSALLQNNNQTLGKGSAFIIQTYDYAGALVSPASGSVLEFNLVLRNSSSQY